MKSEDALQISTLINAQNNLPVPVTKDDIYYGRYFYLRNNPKRDESEILACVRAKRQSFFCIELKHLSVAATHTRLGLGKAMVVCVEEHARNEGVPLVVATTCSKNSKANSLFANLQYTQVCRFDNPKTKNTCIVWQKALKLEGSKDV